jgi:hypothetical protein
MSIGHNLWVSNYYSLLKSIDNAILLSAAILITYLSHEDRIDICCTEVRLVIQIANDGLRGDLLQLYSASNK